VKCRAAWRKWSGGRGGNQRTFRSKIMVSKLNAGKLPYVRWVSMGAEER
jgi:hypothetical protein